jgi:hypothetical protein
MKWNGCNWNLLRRMRYAAAFWTQRNSNALREMFETSSDGGLLLHVAIERMEA